MTGTARWDGRQIFERFKPGRTASSGADGAPVVQAVGWSIGVVLLGGVLAVFTTGAVPAATVLQQANGEAVPVEQAAPEVPGGPVALNGEAPQALPTASSGPAAASTSSSVPPTSAKAAKAKAATTAKPAPATTAKAAPAVAAARLQPAPGSYALRISGTSSVGGKATAVPTSGSLLVESRGGDQLHRTVGVPGGLVLVQRANAAGTDLVSFSLSAGSKTLSFAPPSPVAFIRTAPGSWSWSARSTDGTVSVSQTANVSGSGPVNVGGAQVPAVTVQRVFTVSGAVQGTVRLTSTVSLVDRLPLIQHQVINVTAAALNGMVSTSVVSDSTATLTSTSPR